MFNTIPTDAPEFFSDRAHYIDCKDTSSRSKANNYSSRFYIFRLGRSVKNYHLRDKFFDDRALALLEKAGGDNKRLVIKGYISPGLYGSSMFVILTHFGIYHRLKEGFMVVNPDTGEEDFYCLLTR